MSRAFRVDPHHALRRALVALFGGTTVGILDEPWSSVTLSGRRHRFRIVSAARPERLAEVAEIEFDLPGHLLADLAVEDCPPDSEPGMFGIEALTIALD